MLTVGCAPKPPLTWARPVQSDTVELAVVGTPVPPAELGDPEVVIRVGPLDDHTSWRDLPLVVVDASIRERRHTRRFVGIGQSGAARATPYGSIELESRGVTWRLVYLTTRSGRVRDEQGYWLPRAMDAERVVVVVDGVDSELRETVEELAAPLALAAWIQPAPAPILPNGPFGVLSMPADAPGGRVELIGGRIEVTLAGETWARDRLGWARIRE